MLIGVQHIHFPEVTSTNDVAWAYLRQGALEGTVITADFQTQGRGRRGRSWVAPRGTALLVSIALRPQVKSPRLYSLTIVAAVAAARAIHNVTELQARLKWPNDIWVDERKVGGILTETEIQGGVIARAVVGIGLNLNQEVQDFPLEWASQVTSLRLVTGQTVDPARLQRTLLDEFEALYVCFRRGEDAALLAAWGELDVTCGRQVWVQGATSWFGRALGIDENGTLWVRSADGQIRPVVAEEVSVLPFPRKSPTKVDLAPILL